VIYINKQSMCFLPYEVRVLRLLAKALHEDYKWAGFRQAHAQDGLATYTEETGYVEGSTEDHGG
jgi:hypothetical protein